MQNFSNPRNDVLLDKNYGRGENESARYSDSDSWDTDFEDDGAESAELYGDVESRKVDLDKTKNNYNVASLTKTAAASLQIGASRGSFSGGGGGGSARPQLKNDSGETVSTKQKPSVPSTPTLPPATSSAVQNKPLSSLPKPPCQASKHVRQVIGNLGQLWPPDSQNSVLQKQNEDDYEPIHSESESCQVEVPLEGKKSFLHSSSMATPSRRAPPRPTALPSVPFVHGASAASALSRLAAAEAAATNEPPKLIQHLGTRVSRTLPTETKEKSGEDKRAATLPPALSTAAPTALPSQLASASNPCAPPAGAPPLVSNRPLPPTPAPGVPTSSAGCSPTLSSAAQAGSSSGSGFPIAALQCRPWFHDVDRRRAEDLVRNGVDGYFLVRPSSQSTNALTLTMWYNKRVYNISIRLRPDARIALGTAKPNEQSFASVEEMVTNYQSENLVLFSGGKRTGLTVLTTSPPHKTTQ